MNTLVTDGGECGGAWNLGIGPLLLSLGITLILVGALFYYVKQRIEVLETSQKEQIHVMQSFIASIGEQFQRMTAYIQEKVGFGPPKSVPTAPTQGSQTSNSRINISDSSDESETDSGSASESSSDSESESEYESSDNSRSSNTTRDSFDRDEKSPQIKIHDVSDTIDTDTMDNVKIIELTSAQIEPEIEPEKEQESESEIESEPDSDSETESDAEHNSDDERELKNSRNDDTNLPVHVTKIDSDQSQSQNQKKTLVINLDGEVEQHQSQYATLTIKQLRQLLKKKNPSMLMNDIAKMKREQLVEMIQMIQA